MSSSPRRPRSINIAGFNHASPIPAASRVGNVVMTGSIYGIDAATGKIHENPNLQVPAMFRNLEQLLAAAGATQHDIVKLTFSVSSMSSREAINEEWLKMFSDPQDRPARHIMQFDYLPKPAIVQCEAYIVLEE